MRRTHLPKLTATRVKTDLIRSESVQNKDMVLVFKNLVDMDVDVDSMMRMRMRIWYIQNPADTDYPTFLSDYPIGPLPDNLKL